MSKAFSAARLRHSTSFPRLTGVSVETFDQMLIKLAGPWALAQSRKSKSGRPWETGGLEDHLLIMLIYYRCYVTQEFLGFFYNVDKSAICRAIGDVPFAVETRLTAIPGSDPVQKAHYAGKKKRHTLKTEITVTAKGRIASVSRSHPGSNHDLAVRRAGPTLRKGVHLYGDSAYQGHDKEHPNIDFPYKKPRKGELTAEEKEYNRGLSRFRVRVEHGIGRMKRFRVISDRFRNPRMEAGFPPV